MGLSRWMTWRSGMDGARGRYRDSSDTWARRGPGRVFTSVDHWSIARIPTIAAWGRGIDSLFAVMYVSAVSNCRSTMMLPKVVFPPYDNLVCPKWFLPNEYLLPLKSERGKKNPPWCRPHPNPLVILLLILGDHTTSILFLFGMGVCYHSFPIRHCWLWSATGDC